MKNLKLGILAAIFFTAYSCNNTSETHSEESEENVEHVDETMAPTGLYSVIEDSTKVSFTAYKTTEKIGVGGIFKEISLYDINEGETALETMNGSKFSIKVNSLFTNDATETRDAKILEFFFGAMNNTSVISGTFHVAEDNSTSIDVKLNDQTVNVPLEFTSNETNTKYSFDGVIELEDFEALEALNSLHKACEALHTGEDGVSKTWSEVAIHAEVSFEQN